MAKPKASSVDDLLDIIIDLQKIVDSQNETIKFLMLEVSDLMKWRNEVNTEADRILGGDYKFDDFDLFDDGKMTDIEADEDTATTEEYDSDKENKEVYGGWIENGDCKDKPIIIG